MYTVLRTLVAATLVLAASCRQHDTLVGTRIADAGDVPVRVQAPEFELRDVWDIGGWIGGISATATGRTILAFGIGADGRGKVWEIGTDGGASMAVDGLERGRRVAALPLPNGKHQLFIGTTWARTLYSYNQDGDLLWKHHLLGLNDLWPVEDLDGQHGVLVASVGGADFLRDDGSAVRLTGRGPVWGICAVQREGRTVAVLAHGYQLPPRLRFVDVATGDVDFIASPLLSARLVRPLQVKDNEDQLVIVGHGADMIASLYVVALTGEHLAPVVLAQSSDDYPVSLALLPSTTLAAVSMRSGRVIVVDLGTNRIVGERRLNRPAQLAWAWSAEQIPLLCAADGVYLHAYQVRTAEPEDGVER